MLGREVVEGKQRLAILGEAGGGLFILQAVGAEKSVEGDLGVLPRLGHPDFLQGALGFRLLALRQFIEDGRSCAPSSAAPV